MTDLAPLLSSDRMDWETPESFLNLVREFAGGQIALDPSTNDRNPCQALKFFTEVEDGLAQDWEVDGLIYSNCPYGRALARWSKKFAEEGEKGRELIVLVPARPDTRWFQNNFATKATALLFWRGRFKFVGAPTSAPFPSLIAYWGKNVERFRQVFGQYGWLVENN
jgi:phage N-6-adenine-methyltransferase